MDKAFNVITKDNKTKTFEAGLLFKGHLKTVRIADVSDTENFRAMCRELKKFEDDLVKERKI